MRTEKRPRRYVARLQLRLLAPLFVYNYTRDAYVMRVIGRRHGPVLRAERRSSPERLDGVERRGRPSLI